MKNLIYAFLLPVVLLNLTPALVPAQIGPGSGIVAKLRLELERTDEVIARARDAVRISSAPVAQMALQYAEKVQEQAWEAFRAARYQQAALLTRQAREKAQNALAYSRVIEQSNDLVLRKLEKVGDMLDQVKEAVHDTPNQQLQDILGAAQDNLSKAWEFYRRQQYRPAVKLANQVERILRKIIQQSDRLNRSPEGFPERCEKMKDIIDGARRSVYDCGSDKGLLLVEQAERQYLLARELAEKGSMQAAFKELSRARQMALDAEKQCGNVEGLENRYQRLLDLANRLKEQIGHDGSTAEKLLDQAYEQLGRARALIDKREFQAVAAALKAAQLTLNQLRDRLGSTDF